jgi:hypothetical protein
MRRMSIGIALATTLLAAGVASAQTSITLPPSGDNQKASVTQYLGPVKVTIDYSSPKVHSPINGEDRRGKIWGTLVPYGMTNLGFGTCKECPWRVGANENTVFTVSNDVKIEGQTLPAGAYGLHMIPGQDEWTIIFSKNSTSWGSFTYDPSEDQLRVKVKPAKSDYHEWLTFEFPERTMTKSTAVMKWEELQVPFTITVDNMPEVYLSRMRSELRNSEGFSWINLDAAANYALQNKTHLPEALAWAEIAARPGFPGQPNFQTLTTLADLQEANGKTADAKATRDRAMNDPSATAIQLHQYARQLLGQGKKQEALAVWQLNAQRHPGVWPVNVGLMRGYSAMGQYPEALKYGRLALEQAPDPQNKAVLTKAVANLEAGKDANQ